jgi:hypothetical protein
MGGSRTRALAAAIVATAAAAAACDAILGLGGYRRVDCAFCDDGSVDGFGSVPDTSVFDANDAPFATDADAGDAAKDVTTDVTLTDVEAPEVSPHETWAHWPMPNPDAAIAPDSNVLLPNQMTYDAGPEGGLEGGTLDGVTHLLWETDGNNAASDFPQAWQHCNLRGPGWRVPTRIELVSLVDFTRAQPAIDEPPFTGTQSSMPYWTSSVVWAPDAGAEAGIRYWTVSFSDGLVDTAGHGGFVRCVNGGTP